MSNPFEVTKAVDFTDAQIAATWVDLPGGGFFSLADPRSAMPKFLVGGKGGGRTHLLRYFSHALQRIRHKDDLFAGIKEEGYVGVYFRCGGLNSSRFRDKGQDDEAWAATFSYYMEIWFGRLTIDLVHSLYTEAGPEDYEDEIADFVKAVVNLFDEELALPEGAKLTLETLAAILQQHQRNLDLAINNAALTRKLDVRVGVSPGRLVFGIPRAANERLGILRGLTFAYLIDEFENLTMDQQRYVNTLIREKELPTTFLVGSRLYGLRTQETLSAGEENKRGSEYDLLVLEDTYRLQNHAYSSFCTEIVRRRLAAFGLEMMAKSDLDDYFEIPSGSLEQRAKQHVEREIDLDHESPWLSRLKCELVEAGREKDTPQVLTCVSFPESPLHEKFLVLLLYRAWARGADLKEAVLENRKAVERLIEDGRKAGKVKVAYDHYRIDLYAQLLDDLRLPQEYYGIDDFVKMSGYLPRNLLVVLKQVTQWSLFLGERPFRSGRISLRAQSEGVREASAWFLTENKGLGQAGEETQIAVRRLASLFREMRFASKPVEVSCSSFSTDRQGLSDGAARCLEEAVSHSLILRVTTGRREKNTHVLHHKYQLNPMLAPLFDLSLALRGVASFSAQELNAIFDPSADEGLLGTVKRRLIARMTAPFVDGAGESQAFLPLT